MKIVIETDEPVSIKIVRQSETEPKANEFKAPVGFDNLTDSDTLFGNFRKHVKKLAKEQGLTYAKIAGLTDIEESTVKQFMCGASDSRRVAEKLADVLKISLLYRDGQFFSYSGESAYFNDVLGIKQA